MRQLIGCASNQIGYNEHQNNEKAATIAHGAVMAPSA
jgi:hypothetical protein